MNKTQRRALFTLCISIVLIVFGVIIFRSTFMHGDRTAGVKMVKIWMWLVLAVSAVGAVFYWKRSTSEVNNDERDSFIEKNALLTSFASVWILLWVDSLIPILVVGEYGSIPVDLLPIINIGIFLIALLVYSVAVLVQYGWVNKGERS